MFEKFTEKAIKVMTDAQMEALNLKHAKLFPEHVFTAILKQKSGIASKFLKATGMTYDFVRLELEKIDFEKNLKIQEILPFSEELKQVLKIAFDKSIEMKNHSIMPEHLFLAIIETKNLNILKLFNSFEVDIARIKSSTERIVQKKTMSFTHPEFSENNFYKDNLTQENLNYILEDENTKEIFISANDFTQEVNLEAIGTSQILSAIIDDEIGHFFDELGIDKEKLIVELNKTEHRQADYDTEFLYTPKARNIIFYAVELAKESGSSCVYPEHILGGILKSRSGSAYKVLKEQNINIKLLQQKVNAKIDQQKTTSMQILKFAKQEATRLGHNIVGSELLLLGIILENNGIGANVLSELGVNIKDARKVVEQLIGYGNNYEAKNFSLSPRAKKVIDNAWVEAKNAGKERIDSEHILLGIIEEKDCVANKVLEALGTDAVEIKEGIKQRL
ncbi:MAG: hypothetical protein MJ180_04325 [Candidatus Gastranaerophilales bacterium]|nr:hypothetical protein [Candidatus Gastranaerophilales bacterium]